MKNPTTNPFFFLAINNYICRLLDNNNYFKNIKPISEGPDEGFIEYSTSKNNNNYKIPPIINAQEVINRTIAGLLILEGYNIASALEDSFVISNDKGDSYFVTGNSCSCPDRITPCKHIVFTRWYMSFRKEQVNLLRRIKD